MGKSSQRTWLVLDCNNLMWRSFHTRGGLSHRGVTTGATFGFFQDLITLRTQHYCSNFVFCFDYGRLKREKALQAYKETRKAKEKKLDPEKLEAISVISGSKTSSTKKATKRTTSSALSSKTSQKPTKRL
jgi:5'-3' exonuclease